LSGLSIHRNMIGQIDNSLGFNRIRYELIDLSYNYIFCFSFLFFVCQSGKLKQDIFFHIIN